MKNKRLCQDLLTAMPFLFWFQAAVMFFPTVLGLIDFSPDNLFIYLFSLASIILLVAVGIMLRVNKATAPVYAWVFIIAYFLLLSTSPTIKIGNLFILLIDLALVVYLSFYKKD